MTDELKPCPFCGKDYLRHDVTIELNPGIVVWCGNCGAIGPNDLTHELADKMWNLRRPDDALRAELAAANKTILELRKAVIYYGDMATGKTSHTHTWITATTGSRWFDAASGSVEDDIEEQVICSICGCEKPEESPSAEPTEQPPF